MFDDLYEKFLKWNRERKYVKDVYFRIATFPTLDPDILIPIEILKGPYAGIVYGIKNFNILDESTGKTTFDYEIITNYGPYDSDLVFTDDKKFSRMVTDILLIVLEFAIKNHMDLKKEILKDEETRDNYIEESVEERIVLKKDSSISEEGISSK